MAAAPAHPLFSRLRALAAAGPVVVAHRGNSSDLPENTLAAFHAARDLGVAMQEFDVHRTRDGQLVCLHDECVDRTTDAPAVLGPGALVAQLTLAELRRLDAASWHRGSRAPEPVPTLAEVLAAVAPGIAMIEHKAGEPGAYVAELRRLGLAGQVLVQSFDWQFVQRLRHLMPETATAALGPRHAGERPDADTVATLLRLGVGMLHWQADALTEEQVAQAHASGLLVCTYTTDDPAAAIGQAAMGIDAMCTNRPATLLALQRSGRLQRR